MEKAVVGAVKKLYNIKVISKHYERDDKYEIPIVVVFIPKNIGTLTPQVYTASSRWILSDKDSSGERALFELQSQVYPYDENMPILDYVGDRQSFMDYCKNLFKIEAERVSDEIDPDWDKYGSYKS